MGLNKFFDINMPYGMKKNSNNEWMVFNREYLPIGWCNKTQEENSSNIDAYNSYPVHSKYKKLTDEKIEKIIKDKIRIHRNEKNEIIRVYFYSDKHPNETLNNFFSDYFTVIKEFFMFDVK